MKNYKNKRYNYNLKISSNNDNTKRINSKNFELQDQQYELLLESSLTTISENFKYYITNIVQPKVVDANKNVIPVNIKHENAEDIVDIHKMGYIRDKITKKPVVPIISFKRLSIEKELFFPTFLRNAQENRIVIDIRSDDKNKYFDFNKKQFYPVYQYYSIGVPDFVNIQFEANIWTSYSYEMDYILERLYYYEGAFYGKDIKSKISITDSGINIIKDVDNQRLVRANVSFEVKGKLLLKDLNVAKNVTKDYSNRVININEKIE